MQHSKLVPKMRKLLEDLPSDPDDIAKLFKKLGIKGTPQDGCDCPVYHYLRQELNDDDLDGKLSVDQVQVCLMTSEPDGHEDLIDTPAWVAEFICAFDGGAYPDLWADHFRKSASHKFTESED